MNTATSIKNFFMGPQRSSPTRSRSQSEDMSSTARASNKRARYDDPASEQPHTSRQSRSQGRDGAQQEQRSSSGSHMSVEPGSSTARDHIKYEWATDRQSERSSPPYSYDSQEGYNTGPSAHNQAPFGNKSRKRLHQELQQSKRRSKGLNTQNTELQDENLQFYTENRALKIENHELDESNRRLRTINSKLYAKTLEQKGQMEHISSLCIFMNDNCLYPYATEKKLAFDETDPDSLRAICQSLLKDVRDANGQKAHVRSLEKQVQSLQQKLLSNVEKAQTVSDDQFAQAFQTLASSIKSLSRSIKFKDTPDILQIGEIRLAELVRETMDEHWNSRARKKNMIEAFIWSILYDHIFEDPFIMFGKWYETLAQNYVDIFGDSHQQLWPAPSELAEKWRYTTIEQIVQTIGKGAIVSGQFQNLDSELEKSIERTRSKVANAIGEPLARLYPALDISRVRIVMKQAFELMLQMSLQRCRIQIVFPEMRQKYTIGQPDLISISESEDIERGRIGFIVNPGLAKWGDAHGKNLDQRLDLVPSLVFVESDFATKTEAKEQARQNPATFFKGGSFGQSKTKDERVE